MNENKRGTIPAFGSKLCTMAAKLHGPMDSVRSYPW
jgi:hypothetical protein